MTLVSRWKDRNLSAAELVENEIYDRLGAEQKLECGNDLVYRKTDRRIVRNLSLKQWTIDIDSRPICKNSNYYHTT